LLKLKTRISRISYTVLYDVENFFRYLFLGGFAKPVETIKSIL